mmetsp:Transcript_3849/g.10604  ORF Transcript_3849/g.10604 Transcript_3849/m.10604 type:complete len:132 (-) Transcript_3849:37-432(-)
MSSVRLKFRPENFSVQLAVCSIFVLHFSSSAAALSRAIFVRMAVVKSLLDVTWTESATFCFGMNIFFFSRATLDVSTRRCLLCVFMTLTCSIEHLETFSCKNHVHSFVLFPLSSGSKQNDSPFSNCTSLRK